MKPWEETWECFVANEGYPGFAARIGDHGLRVFESLSGEDDDTPRARLAAAAPDLVRVLLAVEYRVLYEGESECVSCFEEAGKPHEPDCALDAALRKAGVR